MPGKTRIPLTAAERTQRWLIAAQVMTLVALVLGLQFVLNTTGGTLFAFSTIGPLLVALAILIVAGAAVYQFRTRHSLFEYRTFKPGEIIIREGDAADCMYFVQEGEVEVIHNQSAEAGPVIARLGPGEYFGEMALLLDQPRNATVRAASPVRLALLGKSNLHMMLSTVPGTREQILKTVQDRAMQQMKK